MPWEERKPPSTGPDQFDGDLHARIAIVATSLNPRETRSREQFLARSSLPLDHHSRRRRRNLLDNGVDLAHLCIATQQVVAARYRQPTETMGERCSIPEFLEVNLRGAPELLGPFAVTPSLSEVGEHGDGSGSQIGVANAVGAYLDGKTAVIATLKCLGAPAALIVRTYLLQVLTLAVAGIAAGLVLGGLAPFAVSGVIATVLPALAFLLAGCTKQVQIENAVISTGRLNLRLGKAFSI